MNNQSKLSPKQVQEIQSAEGSLREIAARYAVSHTTIGWIKRGFRKPRPTTPARPTLTTPVGVIVRERLSVPEFSRFSVDVRFQQADAMPIVSKIEDAIAKHLEEAMETYSVRVTKTHRRPYREFEDGSVVFVFKTRESRPPTPPRTVSVAGNKLRKPHLLTAGRRVSISFEIVPWCRGDDVDENAAYVGVLLGLNMVVAYSTRKQRK